MANVSFAAPTDYQIESEDLARRREYAKALQAQSLQPTETQTVGGWAIRNSPLQGLGKVAQAYAARKALESATTEQRALGERYNTDRGAALAQALRAGTGAPATSEAIVDEQANGGEGAPATITAPAMQGSRKAMIAALTGSKFPDLQDMGMKENMADMKPTVLGRTLVRPGDGSILATDSTWQAEQDAARLARTDQAKAERERKEAELEARLSDQRLAREDRAALQRELQESRAQSARELRTLAGSLRPAPAVQPLVQIMGPDNVPVWVERKDAVGKTPAGAGSKAEATAAGKSDVDKDVVKLKDAIDRLREGGGMTDTTKGPLANIGAAIGSSAVGQAASGAVGSKNQSARNDMLMIRPSLLRSIMQSTGMSAKQMDSNAELKLWLSTATDPTKDYQSNINALNNIAAKYGGGGFLEEKAPGTPPAPSGPKEGDTATGPNNAKVVFSGGKWVPM